MVPLGSWQLAEARDRNERWLAFRNMLMAARSRHLPAMLDLARRMLEGRELEQDAFLEAAEMRAEVTSEQ